MHTAVNLKNLYYISGRYGNQNAVVVLRLETGLAIF